MLMPELMSLPLVFGHEDLSRDQLLLDRGLHYGDGLFETIAVVNGHMPLLEHHLARLTRDSRRLLGHYPEQLVQQRLHSLHQVLIKRPQPHVAKLLITRGQSGRGYAYDNDAPLRVFAYLYPYQPLSHARRLQGLHVIRCEHLLAQRGWLGTIKHCNRLDQVIARSEVVSESADEGLMFSESGHLIEATSANVAVKLDGHWYTPELNHVGVAGVARQLMVERGLLTVANIHHTELHAVTHMVIFNSVQGIVPVQSCAGSLALSDNDLSVAIDELSFDLPPHMRGVW